MTFLHFIKWDSSLSVPTLVRDVNATATSKENITLHWHRPETMNGVLDKYAIEYKHKGNTNYITVHDQNISVSMNFTSLKNYMEYSFRVSNFAWNSFKNFFYYYYYF